MTAFVLCLGGTAAEHLPTIYWAPVRTGFSASLKSQTPQAYSMYLLVVVSIDKYKFEVVYSRVSH